MASDSEPNEVATLTEWAKMRVLPVLETHSQWLAFGAALRALFTVVLPVVAAQWLICSSLETQTFGMLHSHRLPLIPKILFYFLFLCFF